MATKRALQDEVERLDLLVEELRQRLADSPEVLIRTVRGLPRTCEVRRRGVLIFSGVDNVGGVLDTVRYRARRLIR